MFRSLWYPARMVDSTDVIHGLRWGLHVSIILYVLSSPLFFLRLGTNIVPTDFVGLVVAAIWCLYVSLSRTSLKIYSVLLMPVVIAVIALGSSAIAMYPLESILSGLLLVFLSGASIVSCHWITDTREPTEYINLCLFAWALGAIAATVIIFGRLFATDGIQVFAPAYSYTQRTQLPYFLVTTAILSVFWTKYYHEKADYLRSSLSIILYFFSTFIVFISISRGPWVALAGVLLPMFVFYEDIRRYLILLNIPGLAFAAYAAIWFDQIDRIQARISSIFDPSDSETTSRLDIYENAIDVALDNPLLGIGWNNYSLVHDISGSAHSAYLTIGAEIGLISMSIYILMPICFARIWLTIARSSSAVPSEYQPLLLAPIAGVLGLFLGQLFSTAILWFRGYWILLGIAAAAAIASSDFNEGRATEC